MDESIQLDVDEKRFKYKKLTASEIAEKVVKETIEIQDVNDTANLSNQNQRIIKALQIENACFNYINKKLSKNYKVQQNIRIGNNEYDIIAISKHNNIDFIYEVKYWSSERPTALITQTLNRLNEAGVNYEKNNHRNFRTKLLIVSNEPKLGLIRNSIEKYLNNSDNSYSFMDIEYISEDELTQH